MLIEIEVADVLGSVLHERSKERRAYSNGAGPLYSSPGR